MPIVNKTKCVDCSITIVNLNGNMKQHLGGATLTCIPWLRPQINAVTNQIWGNKNITQRYKIYVNIHVRHLIRKKNFQLSVVESVLETVTTHLGYAKLKIEQKDVILSFVSGRMFS